MGTYQVREKVLYKIMSNVAQPFEVVLDYSCIQYRYLLCHSYVEDNTAQSTKGKALQFCCGSS